jgi:branched-subunit amino acid aminotransferase/4-amino-4-deoxychorismate lyase
MCPLSRGCGRSIQKGAATTCGWEKGTTRLLRRERSEKMVPGVYKDRIMEKCNLAG